jgi:hypothetical protein
MPLLSFLSMAKIDASMSPSSSMQALCVLAKRAYQTWAPCAQQQPGTQLLVLTVFLWLA